MREKDWQDVICLQNEEKAFQDMEEPAQSSDFTKKSTVYMEDLRKQPFSYKKRFPAFYYKSFLYVT